MLQRMYLLPATTEKIPNELIGKREHCEMKNECEMNLNECLWRYGFEVDDTIRLVSKVTLRRPGTWYQLEILQAFTLAMFNDVVIFKSRSDLN